MLKVPLRQLDSGALRWGMQRCLELEGLSAIWKGAECFSNYFHMWGPLSFPHLNSRQLPPPARLGLV